MKIRVVLVTWVDAQNGVGWYAYDRKKNKLQPIPAAGILVDHNEEFLKLAFSFDKESGEYVGAFDIPAGMVRSVKTIKTVEV